MNIDALNNIDLPGEDMQAFYYAPAGVEHYRLLNFLCKSKELVFDVGTYWGYSAMAMSSAREVVSYDTESQVNIKLPKNVTCKIGNAIEDERLLDAELILLDTAHDGSFEELFLKHLLREKYKGVVLMDDIYHYADLDRLFRWVSALKSGGDFTKLGHYAGTGVLYF